MFLAFLLDAFVVIAQSLIGYFHGADRRSIARLAARVACRWALVTDACLLLTLLLFDHTLAAMLVPPSAHSLFLVGLSICALTQPVNSLSFVTDRFKWGTGDYAYLRNVMIVATGTGVLLLSQIDPTHASAFAKDWLVMTVWIVSRSTFAVLRVWPGTRNAILQLSTAN